MRPGGDHSRRAGWSRSKGWPSCLARPRRVSVEFAEPVELEELAGLPGGQRPRRPTDGRVTFRVAGTWIRSSRRRRGTRLRSRADPAHPRGGLPHLLRGRRMIALIAAQLHDRRRSVLSWGLPLGLMVGVHRLDLPLDRVRALKAIRNYPPGPEGSLRDRRAREGRAVPPCRDVEPDRAAGRRLPRGALDRQRLSGPPKAGGSTSSSPRRLSPAAGRGRLSATAVELAAVLVVTLALTVLGSVISGAGLSFGSALAGFADAGLSACWRRAWESSQPGFRCGPAWSPARWPGYWSRCT